MLKNGLPVNAATRPGNPLKKLIISSACLMPRGILLACETRDTQPREHNQGRLIAAERTTADRRTSNAMEVRSGRLDSFSGEDLESARDVLISRFTVGKKSADHNRALIKRIFSGATFHCHRAGREVPTAGCSLALGEVGGRCVAVGCYRHVPAPRRSSLQGFTELLLLAVETVRAPAVALSMHSHPPHVAHVARAIPLAPACTGVRAPGKRPRHRRCHPPRQLARRLCAPAGRLHGPRVLEEALAAALRAGVANGRRAARVCALVGRHLHRRPGGACLLRAAAALSAARPATRGGRV